MSVSVFINEYNVTLSAIIYLYSQKWSFLELVSFLQYRFGVCSASMIPMLPTFLSRGLIQAFENKIVTHFITNKISCGEYHSFLFEVVKNYGASSSQKLLFVCIYLPHFKLGICWLFWLHWLTQWLSGLVKHLNEECCDDSFKCWVKARLK